MNENVARYECYKIFSLLFKMPDEHTWLKCDNLKNLQDNMKILKIPEYKYLNSINDELQNVIFEDVRIEFTKLFLGPFEVLVPPYGSCYIEGVKQVMQESSMNVKKYYNKFDIDVEEGFNDLPDHIVPELEFMYYLLYNEIEHDPKNEITAEQYCESSKYFFKKYLMKFALDLSEEIKKKTELKMFQELAAVFAGFIKSEALIIFSMDKNAS